MSPRRIKTLVVGLDAACWRYLQPQIEAGRTPHLGEIISAGVAGTLRSTLPALTPVAWSSIITGKNPGKHGVFDMLWRRPQSYELMPVNTTMRYGTPFWRYLTEAGIRVGLVNIPFGYPPEAVDGFYLCGFGTPASVTDVAYPEDVIDWIKAEYDGFEPDIESHDHSAAPEERYRKTQQQQSRFVEIACRLTERYDVDVLVINLMLLDHTNHITPGRRWIEHAIRASDEDLGTLVSRFEPDNVLLFSDHGSRRVRGDFLLHAWLEDRGYSSRSPREGVERKAALNTLLQKWLRGRRGLKGDFERACRASLRELAWRWPGGFRWLSERLGSEIARARAYIEWKPGVDYTTTSLFPGSQRGGVFYFNVEGRDPQGAVPQRRVDSIVEELTPALLRLEDPRSGRRIFSGVYTSDQLYHGPFTSYAPDLILDDYEASCGTICSYYDVLDDHAYAPYFIEARRSFGWHRRDGVFVFAGPAFRQESVGVEGSVMDVPAMVLYLHGVPIPHDYDGVVLEDALSAAWLNRHPIVYQEGDPPPSLPYGGASAADASQADEVVDRLKALGYL